MNGIGYRIALISMLLSIVACSGIPPRQSVPAEKLYRAEILPGVPAVRAWAGSFSKEFSADLVESVRQEMQTSLTNGEPAIPKINVLTLSGGADYGAFGAGFMNGWSQAGTRPIFKFVTGISAGALIAPFAFLGREYDSILKEVFTTIDADDIYTERGISVLWSESLVDSKPLANLIEKYFNHTIQSAVARAHRQGRRLYIGTTNMDADRLIVWNMGAIASSSDPRALKLFHKVILASSSIPLTFPPVMIKVEVNGDHYEEMHVDGGVKAQLFLTAATVNLTEIRKRLGLPKTEETRTRLYIIRNSTVGPKPKPIQRTLSDISKRAVDSLIKSQARSDLVRIHSIAKEQGFGFNWVCLPSKYPLPESQPFDMVRMKRLFSIGYETGLSGNAWRNQPPGIGQR